jgi:hypothetical protein
MKKKFFLQVFIVTLLISLLTGRNNYSLAQTAIPNSSNKSFRLFEEDKIIDITLRFDLSSYLRTKPTVDYLKANMTIYLSKKDSITRDIGLRTYGTFRNKYCQFAPIELNIEKAHFGYSDLDNMLRLKLVPGCTSSTENKNYILKEYLAYKLFNVITDTSFRVRLITFNFMDTEKKKDPIHKYGIFIEPVEMLTARTSSVQIESANLNQKDIIPEVMDRLAIFNYMIGNYDWSVAGLHNILVIKPFVNESTSLGIAIPYNFDWAGLVNASYAIPSKEMGIENIRDRIFIGICRNKEVYLKYLELFSEKKDEFYRVINEFPYLDQKEKKDVTDYLDGFFNLLAGNKDMLINTLINTCKRF